MNPTSPSCFRKNNNKLQTIHKRTIAMTLKTSLFHTLWKRLRDGLIIVCQYS